MASPCEGKKLKETYFAQFVVTCIEVKKLRKTFYLKNKQIHLLQALAPNILGSKRLLVEKHCFKFCSIYSVSVMVHRKRIRSCCDELNTMVPFCDSDTDKVTTLQWTTAFLRYINKTYGNTFKEVCLCGTRDVTDKKPFDCIFLCLNHFKACIWKISVLTDFVGFLKT